MNTEIQKKMMSEWSLPRLAKVAREEEKQFKKGELSIEYRGYFEKAMKNSLIEQLRLRIR